MLTMAELLMDTEEGFVEVHRMGMMSDNDKKSQIDFFMWEHLALPVFPVYLDYFSPDHRGMRIDRRCKYLNVESHVADGCKLSPGKLATYKKLVRKLKISRLNYSCDFIEVFRVCQNRENDRICKLHSGNAFNDQCAEVGPQGVRRRSGVRITVTVEETTVVYICTFDRERM